MPVDPKELREAIRAAIYACRKMAKQHVAASAYRKPQANICEADRFYDAAEVLRAFLNSGLTDSERVDRDERNIVREVFDGMDSMNDPACRNHEWASAVQYGDLRRWMAALAPIVEKGRPE